jgi:hypothetical protein
MRTLNQVVKSPSGWDSLANYTGQSDFPGWFVLVTRNRDSDCLTESNFRSALKALGGESETVEVHRFGHWACGWWEALCVKEGSEQFTIAQDIAEKLEDYPVVDEDDWSELEHEEASRVWAECYNVKERVEYIRQHREQFEFHNFADLLGCARGLYFAGYASELLN